MDAEEDTITTLRRAGTTVHPPDEISALVEMFYMPALSAWNRYLTSQGAKMSYMFRKNQA